MPKIRCSGCGEDCTYSVDNPFRPFCSARCKNNDFGSWASERFSVDADADSPAVELDPKARIGAPDPHMH